MTGQEVAKMLQAIDATYRVQPLSNDAADARLSVWCVLFRDIPHRDAQQALIKCFSACKFPPTPADLLALIGQSGTPGDAELWDQAMRAGKRIADIRDYISVGGMTDGRGTHTPGELAAEARRIFAELPQGVREWAGNPFGLAEYYNMDHAALLRYERPRFDHMMQQYRTRGEYAKLLPAAAPDQLTAGQDNPPEDAKQLPAGAEAGPVPMPAELMDRYRNGEE